MNRIREMFCGLTQRLPYGVAVAVAASSTLVPAPVVLAESVGTIEEVVVTARKRQETLQEVPVVVNVLTEDSIRSQRIESIRDIGTIVPGMVASKTISGTSGMIFLRGVGTGAGNPAFDQAVSINLDGMGINSAQMMNAGMFDLRQIEVLKGPQALFFGKNSPGGVIAIHTNDPGDEFELELTGMYEGVAEETSVQGIISGPITDTLGARLAFNYSKANDTWFDVNSQNAFETGPLGPVQTAFEAGDVELETTFLLGTLLWKPSDTFSAKLKFAHLQDDETGPGYNAIQRVWCPNNDMPQGTRVTDPGFRCRANDETQGGGINPAFNGALKGGEFAGEDEAFFDNENNSAVLEINYDVNDSLTLTSVTGYFENEETRFADSTFSLDAGLPATFFTELEQWTQEIRLVSSFDGNVNFSLGAFYEDKEIRRDSDVAVGVFDLIPVIGSAFPVFVGRQASQQDGTSWSVFGQVIWDISDDWTLAVGGRYSDEEKKASAQILIPDPNVYAGSGLPSLPNFTDVPHLNPKESWDNFSPEVTLSYQLNDDVMFFGSYREGFKSGGYDLSYGVVPRLLAAITPGGGLDNTYNEERVEGFEVGMKSTLLDGSMRFNVTGYTFKYDDLQLSRFNGETLSFALFNAGKASVDGIEVETLWATPVEGLTLTANIAWANSEFDEFIAPCFAGQTIALGCDTALPGGAFGSDKAGENLPFASDWSATLGATYDTSLSGNWNLGLNFNASFKDDYNPVPETPPEEVLQDSYWWVNAGVSIYSSDDRWEFFARGVNLTDEVYLVSGAAAPFQGNAALSGTNDASGVPDFIAYVQGGRQFLAGLTFRM